jgi:hypothetical protein
VSAPFGRSFLVRRSTPTLCGMASVAQRHSGLSRRRIRESGCDVTVVIFRSPGFHFSGGGIAPLGRVGADAPGQKIGQGAVIGNLLVGTPASLRHSAAMPPCSLHHRSPQLLRAAQSGQALSTTASHNRSANADTQVLRAAARRQCSGAGCLQR